MQSLPQVRFLARPNLRAYTGFISDFAKRGLTLLVQEPLEPGTLLAIQFQTRHLGASDILSAQVKHVTLGDEGTWLVGCKLSRNLSRDEMNSLSRSGLQCT
jgi:hypothetical protein